MAGLLLCNKQSLNPYYISDIDINVYSIEEISYFLFHHIFLVGPDFFCNNLVQYLKDQLGLSELADQLSNLMESGALFSEMVMLILKESSYYSENELKQISDNIYNIDVNSLHRRLKAKADLLYNCNKYISALDKYKEILELKREPGLIDEFYANTLNNIGVIFVKLFNYGEAEKYFKLAYDLYQSDVYLKKIVMVNLMYDNQVNLLNNIRVYNISDELLKECRQEYLRECEEVQNQEEYIELKDLLTYDKQDVDAYYKGLHETVEQWKSDYRELF